MPAAPKAHQAALELVVTLPMELILYERGRGPSQVACRASINRTRETAFCLKGEIRYRNERK
jgi:hypothetical protein